MKSYFLSVQYKLYRPPCSGSDRPEYSQYFLYAAQHLHGLHTDMRRLTTGIRSAKCVVRRFHRCANVVECTYTKIDSIAYYTPSRNIAYFP